MKSKKISSRIVFTPTKQQKMRINNLFMKNGKFATISEMMRHILEIGLDKLESDNVE